jgi:hypothetical protein
MAHPDASGLHAGHDTSHSTLYIRVLNLYSRVPRTIMKAANVRIEEIALNDERERRHVHHGTRCCCAKKYGDTYHTLLVALSTYGDIIIGHRKQINKEQSTRASCLLVSRCGGQGRWKEGARETRAARGPSACLPRAHHWRLHTRIYGSKYSIKLWVLPVLRSNKRRIKVQQ